MELVRYSKNFLPFMFNLHTTAMVPAGAEEAGQRLKTNKLYFMVSDIELVNTTPHSTVT